MTNDDITVQILIDIRDEIRTTNKKVDQTNVRVDQLGERVDALGARLDKRIDNLADRIVESEIRTASAVTELAGTVRAVHSMLSDRFDLRDRVERCERDIAELKQRVE
jgi:chromosome segregation ATPase